MVILLIWNSLVFGIGLCVWRMGWIGYKFIRKDGRYGKGIFEWSLSFVSYFKRVI